MSGKSEEAIFVKGKNAFAEICTNFGCEHLHIRQEKEDSSTGTKDMGHKRPDFLVNIPDLTSLFVDVKVRQQVEAGSSDVLSGIRAFEVDCHDYWKMKKLEGRMRITSWYAFIEMKGATGIYESSAFLVPLSRVEKNIPDKILSKLEKDEEVFWRVRIPVRCMNEWDVRIDLSDRCQGCVDQYCKQFPK